MISRGIAILPLLLSFFLAHSQNQLSQNKPERLFAKGKELIDHHHYGPAREVFNEFLSRTNNTDPRRGEAQYYVAFSALNLGHADGEKLIDQFVTEYPSSPKASTAYYDLAIFFYQENNFNKAIDYFEKVDFPALTRIQQDKGHFSYGYSYFSKRELSLALEQFNFVKDRNNEFAPAASYYSGFIEYTQGANDKALADLRRAEKSSAYANVVPYLIANVYFNSKQYDALLVYINEVKTRTNVYNMEEIAMLEGEAHYRKHDYTKAVPAYEKYLNSNDKAASAVYYRAGHACYLLEQDEKAIGYLKKAAASTDSVSYHASYYLGILYLKQGEKRYAVNAFDHARKSKVDENLKRESGFQFAKVSYDVGNTDLAIRELESYLKDYPHSNHDEEVRELLAQAYVNGNNFNKAIQYIESLTRRNHTMDRAYQKATYLKAIELFNKENFLEAVRNFEKSLTYPIDPNITARASFWCGEAYAVGYQFEDAKKHYLTVIGMGTVVEKDILLRTRYGLGYAYYNTQAYDRALISFKEFVNQSKAGDANYYDATIRLADCYYVTKSYETALQYYNKAQQLGKTDNDYVLLQQGIVSGVLSQYGSAKTHLSTLLNNYPTSPYRDDAWLRKAEFEIEQGNYQPASEALTHLITESKNSPFLPKAYERRAVCYANLGNQSKAADDYIHLIQVYPGDELTEKSILSMQNALIAAGRSDEFQRHLDAFKKTNPNSKGLESVEYETAKNVYFSGDYNKAITALAKFVSNYPNSPNLNEAKYYLADSYYRQNEMEKAYPLFKSISTDASLAFGNRIAYRLAEISWMQKNYQQAVTEYKMLERLANSKKDLFNAWSGLVECYYLLGEYDSVTHYANLILEKGNVNISAQNKASLFIGKAAYGKGDHQTAKDEFLNTLNTAHDEFGAEAKYLLGEIFFIQKDHKACYETLVGLSEDFSAYEEWVGKAFLLLADNFLATGDVFQAKATLESLLPHFPITSIREKAKKKLKEIETRQKLEEAEADSLEVKN